MTNSPDSRQYLGNQGEALGSASDAEIISRVLAGERNEYRHIVSRYKNIVFSILMKQTGNTQLAEDLAQQTFIKAYRGLKGFRADSKLSTWLVRIALNCSHTHFNSRQYKNQISSEEFNPAQHSGVSESPHEGLEREQRMQRFRHCLARLKPTHREIVCICALEEKSYEEAAEIASIPVGTVRSRLNTARLKLKTCMQQALLN